MLVQLCQSPCIFVATLVCIRTYLNLRKLSGVSLKPTAIVAVATYLELV